MRIFKTKWFTRFARKERVQAGQLVQAIARAESGNIDADLGGHLIKQRVARAGEGRSGGFRTLIAYHSRRRSIFLYGFAKNRQDNISEEEFAVLKKLASRLIALDDLELSRALEEKELIEVLDETEKEK